MSDNPYSLYNDWFSALPGFFRVMMPVSAAGIVPPPAAPAAPAASALPFPVDQIGNALTMTSALLSQLYQSFVPALAQSGFGPDAITSLASAGTETYQRMQQALAMPFGTLSDMQKWSNQLS